MRWLINYIRSCFCKHEWELIFETNVHCERDIDYRRRDVHNYTVKTYRCKHCGYTQKYKSS